MTSLFLLQLPYTFIIQNTLSPFFTCIVGCNSTTPPSLSVDPCSSSHRRNSLRDRAISKFCGGRFIVL